MFVYKHTEQLSMLKFAYLLRKIQTLRANKLRIIKIKNVTFSGYYFYMDLNVWGDSRICISVPLKIVSYNIRNEKVQKKNFKVVQKPE